MSVIAVEIGAALYIRFTAGFWIWSRPTAASDSPQKPAEDAVKTKMVLHPYLGTNTVTGLRFDTLWPDEFYKERITALDYLPSYYRKLTVNRHGFWSLHEYPYRPSGDEAVVGIFGGSFAFHFWLSALDEKSPALKQFEKHTGKRLVLLNFASGGRKQPESLLALSYFLALGQRFDFVLNLDGFNDAYVTWLNATNYKTDFSMPFAEFVYKIQNSFAERVQAGSENEGTAAFLSRYRDKARRWRTETRVGLVFLASPVLDQFLTSHLNEHEAELSRQRGNVRYPVQVVRDDRAFDKVIPDLAALWFNSSVSMATLARSKDIPYLHVLQPNQYFSRKILSKQETEWKVRGATEVPLSALVPPAYEAFRSEAQRFGPQGVSFIDATTIYDRDVETVFIDWCCHVNERGNRTLNELIEPAMNRLFTRAKDAAQTRR